MRFLIFVLAVMAPYFVHAQDSVTLERAHAIATQKVPGVVTRSNMDTEDGLLLYEIEIQKDDGSIYEVEVDAKTGEIIEVEIESLGKNVKLPDPVFSKREAEVIALDHIKKSNKTGRKPIVQDIKYKLYNGRTVYEVVLKKLFTTYVLIIDADNGKILNVDKDGE